MKRGEQTLLLGYFSDLVSFAPYDEDAFVFIFADKLGERCMALYEHAHVEGHFETIADFLDSLRFGFTAAIREEDEGNALFLEIAEGFAGAGKGIRAAEEDAINAGDWLDLCASWSARCLYSNANAKSETLGKT